MAFDLLSTLADGQAKIAASLSLGASGSAGPADYPWIYPPPGSAPFDYQGGIPLPAIAAPDAVVVQFTVPPGWDGVIKRLSCNFTGAGFLQGSGNLIWRVLQNGIAVKGYDSILTELGDLKTPRSTDGILVYENQIVQLMIANVNQAAGGSFVLGSFGGYFWSR